ncbi:hypothetical protein BS78_03G281300 [Paspalum vaginatum]|nr:hypothetical protein BS78_03G281300 [Paspalum vaginatum]
MVGGAERSGGRAATARRAAPARAPMLMTRDREPTDATPTDPVRDSNSKIIGAPPQQRTRRNQPTRSRGARRGQPNRTLLLLGGGRWLVGVRRPCRRKCGVPLPGSAPRRADASGEIGFRGPLWRRAGQDRVGETPTWGMSSSLAVPAGWGLISERAAQLLGQGKGQSSARRLASDEVVRDRDAARLRGDGRAVQGEHRSCTPESGPYWMAASPGLAVR